MHKIDFVPPQASRIQEEKHMQIDCAQRYQSGSNPIKMTNNWYCFAKITKTFHEIARREESLAGNESQVLRPIDSKICGGVFLFAVVAGVPATPKVAAATATEKQNT